jgi:hypothetical protein
MKPTITTNVRSQLAELASRAEARDLCQRRFDRSLYKTIEVVVPAHWACPLLYGDYTGLWRNEERELDSYLDHLRAVHNAHVDCVDIQKGEQFAWRNDVNNVGGPTCIATFSISPRQGYLAQV